MLFEKTVSYAYPFQRAPKIEVSFLSVHSYLKMNLH